MIQTLKIIFVIFLMGLAVDLQAQTVETRDPDEISVKVFNACGGQWWDKAEIIGWTFFGSRKLQWDKSKGDFKVEYLKKPIKIELNLNTGTGKVYIKDSLQTHPDSISKYLSKARLIFYNDSYWLLMPLKLLDKGVNRTYLGERKSESGDTEDILQLTFNNVGATPENKYHVYINRKTSLVTQWDYFDHFNDKEPSLSNPWTDYKNYNGLILSSGRGDKSLSDIYVTISR